MIEHVFHNDMHTMVDLKIIDNAELLSCLCSETDFDLYKPKIPPLWETLRLPPPTDIQNLNVDFSSNLEQPSKLNRNARKNDFDESYLIFD